MNLGRFSSWQGSAWVRFGMPISSVVLIAIPTFISRIIFLRVLSVEGAAQLVLVFAAVPLCAFVGNLGQSGVIARHYSRIGKGEADWKADLIAGGALITLPTLLCVASLMIYNRLDLPLVLGVAFSALCFSVTQQIAMMLVATEQFTLGSVLDRLSGTMLIVPAIAVLFSPIARSVFFVVLSYTLLNVAILFLGLIILQYKLPRGTRKLGLQERKIGALFWMSSGVSYLREHILIVVVQPAVAPLSLAAFDAVSVLFRGFEITRQPLSSIMLVDITRSEKPAYGRRILGVLALGVAASVFVLIVFPAILNPLYMGRYDQASWMIPWLLIYHVVGWLYSIPSGYIFGRSSDRIMASFIRYKVIIAVIIMSVGSIFSYQIGFPAFLATLVASVVIQTALGYVYLYSTKGKGLGGRAMDPVRQLLSE